MAVRTYCLSFPASRVIAQSAWCFGLPICLCSLILEFTVRANSNGLSICVASVSLLSVTHACLDFVILWHACRRPLRISPTFIAPKDEVAQCGSTTTAGCPPNLLLMNNASTSPSGPWYADDGSEKPSYYAVSWLHKSLTRYTCKWSECFYLHVFYAASDWQCI